MLTVSAFQLWFTWLIVELLEILPEALQLGFTLEIPPSTPIFSLSSIVSTYLHRASHVFTSLFPSSLVESLDDVRALVSFFDSAEGPAFAAVDLSRLDELDKGSPEETSQIIHELRAFLNQIVQDGYSLAVLTYTPSHRLPLASERRLKVRHPCHPLLLRSSPFMPFQLALRHLNHAIPPQIRVLEEANASRLQRLGALALYATAVSPKSGEGKDIKTEYWAGEKCSRKDISGYVTRVFFQNLLEFELLFFQARSSSCLAPLS
jgi:hypothetical protein